MGSGVMESEPKSISARSHTSRSHSIPESIAFFFVLPGCEETSRMIANVAIPEENMDLDMCDLELCDLASLHLGSQNKYVT